MQTFRVTTTATTALVASNITRPCTFGNDIYIDLWRHVHGVSTKRKHNKATVQDLTERDRRWGLEHHINTIGSRCRDRGTRGRRRNPGSSKMATVRNSQFRTRSRWTNTHTHTQTLAELKARELLSNLGPHGADCTRPDHPFPLVLYQQYLLKVLMVDALSVQYVRDHRTFANHVIKGARTALHGW